MTTTTRAPASRKAPLALDLDARLALTAAEMSGRLDRANVAYEIRTAHIAGADPIPEVTAPPRLTPAPASCPYRTPLAVVLHQAQTRLEAGWCTGQLRDDQGGVCLIGAIRAVAASRGQADDACAVLLEAIRRDFRDATTVPAWNDSQTGPRFPLLYLGRAADLAHARLI